MSQERAGASFDDRGDPAYALWAVTRWTQEAQHAMARRLGLGVTDLLALEHLMGPEPIGPVELGQRLGLRSASATALVDRLEAAGHVERRRHPSDRRRLVLVATPHAARESAEAIEPMLDGLRAVTDELGPQEREAVLGYLRRVLAVIRDYAS